VEKKREDERAKQEADRQKDLKERNGGNGGKSRGLVDAGTASPGTSDAGDSSGSRAKSRLKDSRPAEPVDTTIRSPLLRPKGDAKKR
jgi:hypothetical protein